MSLCGAVNFRERIADVWTVSVFWGLYVSLFCYNIQILIKQQRPKLLYVVSTLNFSLSTVAMLLTVVPILLTPMQTCASNCSPSGCYPCGGLTSTIVHETNINNMFAIVEDAVSLASAIVADGFFIWRLYMIWNRNLWAITLPTICLAGTFGTGCYLIYTSAALYWIRLHAPISEIQPPPRWLELSQQNLIMQQVTDIIPLATNIIITFLAVARILYITHGVDNYSTVKRTNRQKYYFVVTVIIESGGLIVVAFLLQILGYYSPTCLNSISEDILGQMMGIAPTLLIVQLAFAPDSNVQISTPMIAVTRHDPDSVVIEPSSLGIGEKPSEHPDE